MTAVNRRQAYECVDRFEQALCDYTGAPYAVATDCCTNALFLSLLWWTKQSKADEWVIAVPKRTYVGVAHAVWNSGNKIMWTDEEWRGAFQLHPTTVIDSAKRFERDMFRGAFGGINPDVLMCVSFGASKKLPIGRGGAILLADKFAADWIRPRTMDGRTPGEDYKNPSFVRPAWRMNMTPEQAVRGLDLLTYLDDNDQCDWTEYPDLSEATWS